MITKGVSTQSNDRLRTVEAELQALKTSLETSDDDLAQISCYNVQTAAGGGAMVGNEEQGQSLAFRRDWLRKHNLNPMNLSAISVIGNSMEPTIHDDATVLINHADTRPRHNAIYAFEEDGDLSIKRLKIPDSLTILAHSDNPEYKQRQLSRNARIIGRVVWTARLLPEV